MGEKFAIVTGASTGIGFELAHLIAQDGYDLLVVADEPLIDAAAQDFRRHGGDVRSLEADLSTLDGVDRLLAAAEGRRIDVLCANAGVGTGGPFLEQDVAMWRRSVDTNVTGTVYLLQKVLADMVARNDGKILVTGSIAGYIPGTFNAVYNATKAFIDNFTEALRNEIKEAEGVTLTTLMPGPTDTEFFERAGLLDTQVGQQDKADPAKVARDGWKALLDGKGHIVSGLSNKLQVAAAGVVPQAILAEQHRKLAEPGSGKD
ncbi:MULTISPECIES: SDR family NAD(P)-dependent oxidoreductase [Sphingobium]|uniref:SDR family NAD(P)-dependent oxidoreductase n=1 Tax=Sphingobium TaxID=165695 RepID=UPI0015EC08FC|nr:MULTISPECIES: SDR family NAD(P)-dependent oxidoreductase [Sphingobium]MCW2361894.1 short-subunit dehydrogenase [Sphingobium sp. B10D3B]MCW2401427.1 short-subunit dehydrogenase [Sphingobium sp. B10D7B]MCW2408407.1 short-subunit dehydrogenase [Sphingobium xanthum]MCW2412285.1 short-subunit dehydrogenase [Sphingobium sp. B8D3D]MCW2415418.1 short-subunit dehydrogenase [Sphingobium sp. B8D3A]